MKGVIKKLSFIILSAFILAFILPGVNPLKDIVYNVQAASVKLNKTRIIMNKGGIYQLEISGSKEVVKWSSSNKKVATVSSDGLVKAIRQGASFITAEISGKSYKCYVNVTMPYIKSVKHEEGIGGKTQFQVRLLQTDVSNEDIIWTSNNEKIVIIDNKGLATAMGIGKAKITATYGETSITQNFNVVASKKNITDAVDNLKIEYGEVNNQIVCIIDNNSIFDLTFGYELAFYDSSNNLVSLSGAIGARDGFFAGDSKVLFFEKASKEYSYYKIRFSDVWGYYYYKNQKAKVDVTVSDPYEFTYNYTEYIAGYPISKTEVFKLMDLNANNRSGNRIMLEASIIFYKGNGVVNVQYFNIWNGNIDVGISVLKNPLNNEYLGGKVEVPEYDNYKVIYAAKSLKQ